MLHEARIGDDGVPARPAASVAAFSKRNKLSDKEIDELQKLIDDNRKRG